MLSIVLKPLRAAVTVLVANDSPRAIAAGAALGLVLGLTPKGNLIAVALAVLLFGFKFNRTAGLLAAMLGTLVSPMLDGFTHKLGAKILAMPSMQETFASWYDMPLGPWLGFNNTVVLGALLVGLYCSYPCYLVCRMLLDRFQAPLAAWLMRKKIARVLLGVDITSRLGMPSMGG